MYDETRQALVAIWAALNGPREWPSRLLIEGDGDLSSAFPVTDLAGASVGAACLAVAELRDTCGVRSMASVDRRLASFWFGKSIRPLGWEMPSPWDDIAGDYQAADGWIRLHTNAPHHRAAALLVLGTEGERHAVGRAVGEWRTDELERTIFQFGGCAAAMRGLGEWSAHPQGKAVTGEPLLSCLPNPGGGPPGWNIPRSRPLSGVRVLDMTRVLAGPVATRFLAGFGADVLRIDPPGWDEPGVVPDVTLGKRCGRLNLQLPAELAIWEGLLRGADVLVHGYRPGALDRLGLDAVKRASLRPGLVDVSLDAYGWTGPWR